MNKDLGKNLQSLKIDKSKKYNDRPRSKSWRYITAIIVIIIIVIAYFGFKSSISPATRVKVTTVTLMTGSESQAALVATGYVVAQRKAEVASKGTGRLKYLGYEEGDTVSSGAIIAELENNDIKANLELAKANLQKAEADSLNAARNYRRQEDLYKSGAITKTVLEDAETAYQLSLATVAGAKASVTAAEVDLENTFIRAPFSGTVLTKNADVGEIVAPFASSASSKGSVVTLADMNSLEIEADVSESNIYKVSVGQKCEIVLDAYPEITYPGHVKKIVPTADRSRATVMTKVAFDQRDDRVLPEMSARVNFFEDSDTAQQDTFANVIAVSKGAITNRDNQKIVFRINGEFVKQVPITTGRELGKLVEIKSGLSQGDKIVLNPPGKMSDNEKIEISE